MKRREREREREVRSRRRKITYSCFIGGSNVEIESASPAQDEEDEADDGSSSPWLPVVDLARRTRERGLVRVVRYQLKCLTLVKEMKAIFCTYMYTSI